jgi:hypothetical protein
MQVDLLALSDRLKGWHSNYRWLRDVGIEAVRSHPARYTRGVVAATWGMLTQGLYRDVVAGSGGQGGGGNTGGSAAGGGQTVVIGGRTLPKPSEGEPIPNAHEGGVSTPDNSIYTVWTSPSEHHLVFFHPGAEARYNALHRRMDELGRNLPDRTGSPSLARRLNQASHRFPPPALWLALGVAALAFRRPRNALALVLPTVAGLLVIVLTALGLPAEPHYSVPVAPAFIFLTAAALFAARREPVRAAVPWLNTSGRRLAGIGVGIAAAAWAAKVYASSVHAYFSTNGAPHDLTVFLRAASKVLHGASPYAFQADQTYAYPPLLAFLAAPFHSLGAGAATVAWTLLSLAAIAAALWLLEVRDWRCYAVTAVYPVTRSAIDLGTVGPLLLLTVAAAWRWRDRLLEPAAAVGTAVALKLFLWPLGVWLVLMRRIRTTLVAVGFALGLALLPWAVIGFDGIGQYPGLLHRLSRDEATSSYSVIALGVRAHLPETVAVALSLLVAAALIGAAVWFARDERRTPRDRDVVVLTLVLAAALAASPIVWVHYFLLLLVPLALTRPRLSLLWFVPFAYYPLGESAWPAGDARKLGIALVATLVMLGAALLSGGRHARPTGSAAEAGSIDERRRSEVELPRLEPAATPKAPQTR